MHYFDEAVVVPVLVLVVYVRPIVLGPAASVVLGTYEVDMVAVGGCSSKVPSCPGCSFVEKKLVASYTRMVLDKGWAFVKGAPKGEVRATVALSCLLE